METVTIIFILFAFILALAISFFQYYYKSKSIGRVTLFLFSLKGLTLFLLLLLFINPSIEKTSYINEKPKLSVLVDNSKSIRFFKQQELIKEIVNKFKSNHQLSNRFDINYYSFGDAFQLNDSLTFNESQTNISKALQGANTINKEENGAVVLLSDGNQTLGNDYEYLSLKKPVYPIIIGDTAKYEDISIAQLNVNRYSFINNQFPVESLIFYDGSNSGKALFTIENKGKIVYRKTINFDAEKTTTTINANLKSEKEGIHFYKAKVGYLSNEKNKNNNTRSFSVEVIDKQSQILILTSFYHPDLGALKKSIESDKQRKVSIKIINENNYQLNDYQLVILYQPDFQFKKTLKEINNKKINYFLISGSKTNWNYLNTENLGIQKNSINQVEDYGAEFNLGFLPFSQKDIGFSDFPPLLDKFGQIKINIPHQILIYQSINGFSSKEPLLFTVDENNHKKVFLLGEGIWKWRSNNYLLRNSFENFDDFLGNLMQYASSKKVRNRLDVDIENIYNTNQKIKIGAFYVDANYEFDSRATLILTINHKETNQNKSFPFSLANNSFQVELESLSPGEYNYTVSVDGQNISRKSTFRVVEYSVEEQFTKANKEKLERLAKKTEGKSFYADKSQELIDNLLNDNRYITVQKAVQKKTTLIDWKWILLVIVSLLTIEWFTRKYHGKI